MLVEKYHDGNCEDKEILASIRKAVDASIQLRSKKELIEAFISHVNVDTQVTTDWRRFVLEQEESDLTEIITSEKLKPEETRKFVANAFRDGALKTTGTEIDKLMPPVSRFGGGGRAKKKQGGIEKLKDYRNKHGIAYTEILLPPNAPPEYADRATLWNAAEEVEKQWNSQLARRFVLALPREIPSELYPKMVRDYCEEHFVSKGMCCDFAIHDPHPPGHNPHCHVMLTMRAMEEHGKWLPKTRKVYDLDENGERIRLPSGNWKSHKEDTVDWNEQYHGEEWRHGWEVVQNRYLEMVGSPERVDLRSYERQGQDIIPTVHMGPAVTQMERRGIETNIGNLNRDIKAANRMMSAIRRTISSLRDWITDILDAGKEAIAELEAQKASPNLGQLLGDYLNLRKAERSEWSRYGQQKGTAEDLKAVSQALIYLKEHNLSTLEDLDAALQGMNENARAIYSQMKKAEKRMKVITGIQKAVADCQSHQAVRDKYLSIGWKARKEAYAESHKDELDSYNKAFRYLKKQGVDLNVNLDSLQAEYDGLRKSCAELSGQLATVKENLKPMKDIRYWVSKVLTPEQAEVQKMPEPKHSVTERLRSIEQQKRNQSETQLTQKKKQDQEH